MRTFIFVLRLAYASKFVYCDVEQAGDVFVAFGKGVFLQFFNRIDAKLALACARQVAVVVAQLGYFRGNHGPHSGLRREVRIYECSP